MKRMFKILIVGIIIITGLMNTEGIAQTGLTENTAQQLGSKIIKTKVKYDSDTTLNHQEGVFVGGQGSLEIGANKTLTIDSKLHLTQHKQIFYGDGNVLFNAGSVEKIDVTWFGAKGNDDSSDAGAIQKAIDAAINSSGVSVVYFPPGIYCIDKPLVAQRAGTSPNSYTFFNLTLLGHQLPYSNPGDKKGGVSVLKVDKEIPFALGIQGARGVHIENLVFDGYLTSKTPIEDLIYKSSNEIYPQERFAPLAAISIDPFSNKVLEKGTYAGMEKSIGNERNSSRILIENSMIQNFPTGIAVSPNGTTKQGDSIAINYTRFLNLVHGIVICQAQSRNIVVDNCSFHRMKYAFNSDDFGEQQGVLPEVNNIKVADGVAWLFKANGNIAYGHFRNVYAEALYGIGFSKINKQPMNFESCTFKFRPMIDEVKGFVNPCLVRLDNASFTGCTFTYGQGKKNSEPLLFDIEDATYINCYFDSTPVNIGTNINAKNESKHLSSNLRKNKLETSTWNNKQFDKVKPSPISYEASSDSYYVENTRNLTKGDFVFGKALINFEPFDGRKLFTALGKVHKVANGRAYFRSNLLEKQNTSVKLVEN